MDDTERCRVTAQLSRGVGDLHMLPTASLPGLVREHAARAPNAAAVMCADGVAATYGDLERESNRLAHVLLSLGASRSRLLQGLLRRPEGGGNLRSGGSGSCMLPVPPPSVACPAGAAPFKATCTRRALDCNQNGLFHVSIQGIGVGCWSTPVT
eukprot:365509-Chlamydomonas_euryale.AAC.8